MSTLEVEIKFQVPREARAAVAAAMARGRRGGGTGARPLRLRALYLDTPAHDLARAGLVWRLRQEDGRWVQTLKGASASALARFEHEVERPDATPEPFAHVGTAEGDRLIELLRRIGPFEMQDLVRYRTEVRRLVRRVRSGGTLVEIAFDEGRIVSGEAEVPVYELEFERIDGPVEAMLDLAQRWSLRHGLLFDPHGKSERGRCLADARAFPPLRKAGAVDYPRQARAVEAFVNVLDECLDQISRNSVGILLGDPVQRVEPVHQMRVGIRRLRSALRCFAGWVPAPPEALVVDLRAVFEDLGRSRDEDVLGGGVLEEMRRVGAPALAAPAAASVIDPVAIICERRCQQMLVAWLAWRHALSARSAELDEGDAGKSAQAEKADQVEGDESLGGHDAGRDNEPESLDRAAQRRLRRWHKRIAADSQAFAALGDAALHDLRKRIKRQRYAVEFFAPLLRRREVARYLEALTAIQERMGTLNDLFSAQARYRDAAHPDPGAWFALGWLSARIAQARAAAAPDLAHLAATDPPKARHRLEVA